MFDTTGTKSKTHSKYSAWESRPSTPEWLKWSSLSPGWTEICLMCLHPGKESKSRERKQDSKSNYAKRTITTTTTAQESKNGSQSWVHGMLFRASASWPVTTGYVLPREILRSSQKSSPFLQTWHWPWACRLSVPAFRSLVPATISSGGIWSKNQRFHSIHIKHSLFTVPCAGCGRGDQG